MWLPAVIGSVQLRKYPSVAQHFLVQNRTERKSKPLSSPLPVFSISSVTVALVFVAAQTSVVAVCFYIAGWNKETCPEMERRENRYSFLGEIVLACPHEHWWNGVPTLVHHCVPGDGMNMKRLCNRSSRCQLHTIECKIPNVIYVCILP